MDLRNLIEKLEYNTVWGVKRFANSEDAAIGKVYSAKESMNLFGTSQITSVRGGLVGAIGSVDQLIAAVKRGAGLKELYSVFKHMFKGNLLLNEGINEIWTIVASASSGTKFDNTNSYLGVGDDDTAADAAQTGLQAVTNKLYKAMDTGYPTYGTSQKATWKSTFGSSDANYDWREFTVANGNSDAAVNMNRKVSTQGTKASGQTWELTLEITLS